MGPRKGVSKIIFSVLMVLIVVSVSIGIFNWSQDVTEIFENTTSIQAEKELEKSGTEFSIIDFRGEYLTIKNKGKEPIDGGLLSFYIDDHRYEPATLATINSGETVTLEFPVRLEDSDILVAGPHGKKSEFLPEISFLKVYKSSSPEEISVGDITTVKMWLRGSGGVDAVDNPIDMVFVTDVSGSMEWVFGEDYVCGKDSPYTTSSYLCDDKSTTEPTRRNSTQEASKNFLLQMDSSKDQVGLVSFGYSPLRAVVEQSLTRDFDGVKNKIDSLVGGGGTPMEYGIRNATQELLDNGREGSTRIQILLSDGAQDAASDAISAAYNAKSHEIKIYTIFFNESDLTPAGFLMQQIAQITGGKYYHADSPGYLDEIYDRLIASDLLGTAGMEIEIKDKIPNYANYEGGLSCSGGTGCVCFYNDVNEINCQLDDISVGEACEISFDLSLTQAGNLLTNVYPDSSVAYKDYLDLPHTKPFPKNYIDVTGSLEWLPGFNFRRNISVGNPNPLLNDYQTKVVVDRDTDMNPDFSDLRFTDSDCLLLSYWIENYTMTEATVWVEVPEIPAGPSNICMYYGNQTPVTSRSNGDSTFLFFDSFGGTHLDRSKWGTVEQDEFNDFWVQNGYIRMRGAWDYYAIFSDQAFDLSEGIIAEWKGRLGQGGPGNDTDIMVGVTPDKSALMEPNGIWTWYDNVSSGSHNQKTIRYTTSGTPTTACGLPDTTDWVRMSSTFNQSATTYWDEVLGTCTLSSAVSWGDVYLTIAADTDSGSRYGYIDWVAVRRYATSDPSAIVSTTEET